MAFTQRHLEILIVEDNPADVRMAQLALEAAGFPHRAHVVYDGEQALLFMLREGPYAGVPRPDLVLLDLMLPKASGVGLLTAIRAHRQLKGLTVIVFTGSSLKQDEVESYTAAADHFMTKPTGLDGYVAAMKRIQYLAPSA